MHKYSISLTACALATLAALTSHNALAQDDRWFQVELLVFAHQTTTPPEGAARAEQWDPTPNLAYPNRSRFLVDPALVAQYRGEIEGESLLDEYGRLIFTIVTAPGDLSPGTPPGAPLPAGAGQAAAGGPESQLPKPLTPVVEGPALATPQQPGNQVPTPLAPVFEDPSLAAAAATRLLPRPFVLLPRSYQEFRGKAALMQRSGRYSMLFHETWVQPVPPEADSLPIVLDRSGDDQQWPRLQGSIKIFLARYLQLETNLWLNTNGEYLPGTWQMPAPPFGPPSLIIEEEEVVDIASAVAAIPGTAIPGTDDPTAAVVTVEASGEQTDTAVAALPATGALPAAMAMTEEVEPVAPVYPFRHAVLLDQKRRMRSNEVHYIDHPLLGLVVKFTPISAEQLAAIATAQEASLEAGQAP